MIQNTHPPPKKPTKKDRPQNGVECKRRWENQRWGGRKKVMRQPVIKKKIFKYVSNKGSAREKAHPVKDDKGNLLSKEADIT